MLLCSSAAFAQDNFGGIHGKLVDAETTEAIPYTSVYVKSGDKKIGTTTEDDGKFIIKPLQPGTYNVYFMSLSNGEQLLMTGISVKPNKIAFAKDLLASNNDRVMDSIEVIHWKIPLINPEDPTADIIDAKAIKQSARIRDPKGMLATMDSGIKLDENGNLSFRGAREGNVVYIVDGVKTSSMNLPGMAYESITAYTGGLPAKYGDSTGGVVIVESKSYFDYYRIWKAQQEFEEEERAYQEEQEKNIDTNTK